MGSWADRHGAGDGTGLWLLGRILTPSPALSAIYRALGFVQAVLLVQPK